MAEVAQDSETVKQEPATEEAPTPTPTTPELGIESQIEEAMRYRVSHFKEEADSLTFEGVRRLLEKDLGLDEFALDVHKRFVKQHLLECLNGAADDNGSKDSEEIGGKYSHPKREEDESPEQLESKHDIKEPCSEDEEKMEDSPVMGLLTGKKTTKLKTEETKTKSKKEVTSESSIKKALWKRASYIKVNFEKVTMAGLRRLLEEDLKLDKFTLDPYKKFISNQLDEVLKSREVPEPKKKNLKKSSLQKASKKVSSEENSDSSEKESDEEDEEEVKPKKKIVTKQKILKSEGFKKRRRPEKETKASGKKRIKPVEAVEEDNSDAEGSGNASDDSNSQSSVQKQVKKKEVSTPAYGKRVEHLKSLIKSCGMSVPPAIYKKVKQVPENKREAKLIKELEEILSREGLSSNPSEKEIKEVKKRKERAKELEGIDMSNIVSSSRRRSTSSYVAPPKPKVPVQSDGEEDDTDDDDNHDDDDEDDDEDNDGDDGSQSEEEEANDEDSD